MALNRTFLRIDNVGYFILVKPVNRMGTEL